MSTFSAFSLRAHAKVNLSLRVLDLRADGYHNLETVFQALGLHDTLDFEPHEGPLTLSCDMPGVPLDEQNLVWRAGRLIWDCAKGRGEPSGVHVRLRKRIPAQGGLGGGSSDAATALVGFARLWLPHEDVPILADMGVTVGADVPFFLCGGTALGLNRGDRVFPLADIEPRYVALVFPPFGVSTPTAYKWLDEERVEGVPGASFGRDLLLAGSVKLPVGNQLEAPVARRHPEIGQVRDALIAFGAEAAAMSGSGSTVFGLFEVREQAARAVSALRREGWNTLLTRTASRRQSSAGAPVLVRTRSSRID
ncbi:MAG: 4-(cytidine 5'-diphospho)-2-C-methyl-D-erythritol kinase [Acidobacteria bacterium]|nr:MAG: 4-(cytidine 5'-diphospho)-2-C-methyl-D-erythritol kinase [Acidobacteriota bacterium]